MSVLDSTPGAAGATTNNPKFDAAGVNTRRSISTAQQAQKIGDGLVRDDQTRDQRRAEVQRAINGAAPYSDRALREKNQGHRFNVSFGYLEGALGRAKAPYFQLALDEEFLALIQAPGLDESKKNIIREKFVTAVKRWGLWPSNYASLVRETVHFGYCSAIFPDPESPWWEAARQREGLVPARSRNVAAKLDLYLWRRSYLIHELYDHIVDEEAAKIAGWSVENVRDALMSAAPEDYIRNRTIGGWQIYEEAIRAGAFALSTASGAKVIETYHAFARELSGKVSHWIVLNTAGQSNTDPQISDSVRLFYQFEQYENFAELTTYFDLEDGDGYWHGSKGLGQKLYGVHRAHDRLLNSGLDQTFRGGLGVLKSNTQKGHQALNLEVTGDFVVLSPDVDAVPGVRMPGLDQTFFSMDAALLATAVQRGGDVAPEAMGVDRPNKTATQSNIDAGQKQVITKANLKRWVPPLSHVINTMFKRLIKVNADAMGQLTGHPDAVRFVQELIEAEITMEEIALVRKLEVFHTVEDVFGETKQSVSLIADKYRADPDCNRVALKQREVEVWLGPAASLQLIPGDADQLSQLHAAREQGEEIATLLQGVPVPVAPDDLHPAHVQAGLLFIQSVAQRIASGDQNKVPSAIDMEHIAAHLNSHIEMLGKAKGQRDMARQLEAQLQQAMDSIKAAVQAAAVQHAKAFQSGMADGIVDHHVNRLALTGTNGGANGVPNAAPALATPGPSLLDQTIGGGPAAQ